MINACADDVEIEVFGEEVLVYHVQLSLVGSRTLPVTVFHEACVDFLAALLAHLGYTIVTFLDMETQVVLRGKVASAHRALPQM